MIALLYPSDILTFIDYSFFNHSLISNQWTNRGTRIRTWNDRVRIRCLTIWLYPYITEAAGFEPAYPGVKVQSLTAWGRPNILGSILGIMIKSHIQNKLLCEPINSYTAIRRRWCVLRCTMGVEPTANGTTSHRSTNWATHTVAEVGFEPTYPSLWGKCVTKSTPFCNRGTEIWTLDLSLPKRAL